MTENRNEELLSALEYIDPASLTYEEWMDVGYALHHEGFSCEVWDEWSRKDPARYKEGETPRKWNGFDSSKGVTGNTIFHLAQQNGWKNTGKPAMPIPSRNYISTAPDLKIEQLKKILHAHYLGNDEFKEPEQWNPESDLIKYLEAVFKPGDIIGYNTNAKRNPKKQKYDPSDIGTFRNVSEIVGLLEQGFKVTEVIKGLNPDAGAWIRINPLDGNGGADRNVIAFRHTLIESDSLSLSDQIRLIHEMKLPVTAMVYSGSKSIHALVKIDADNEKQYTERVSFLYGIAERYGLPVDKANRNESRMSRLPGVMRGEHKQFLIETNTGCASYAEWEMMVKKGMVGIEMLKYALESPRPLKPFLINGLLRVSHKMMIAGQSKAGKTWLLMDLAVAIATGSYWLNRQCMKGNVLYLNMEVDPGSYEDRFMKVFKKRGLTSTPPGLDVMHLRGKAETLDVLASKIIDIVKETGETYIAIFIDPFYKVLKGDENSNSDMAEMGKAGDRLAEETGATLIYCHHFSKGKQNNKASADRASGAGAFARDPDALMTLTQYDQRTTYDDKVFEIEYTTREVMTPNPDMVRFNFPLFEIVPRSEYPEAQIDKTQKSASERDDDFRKVIDAYRQCEQVSASSGEFGVKKPTLLNMVKQMFPEVCLDQDGHKMLADRSLEKALLEKNPYLKNISKSRGTTTIYALTSSAPIKDDDEL